MPSAFDVSKVDWNNPDVIYLCEHFNARFEEDQKKIETQGKEIEQLKAEIQRLNGMSGSSTNARSYNVREYKDYPRTKDSTKRSKKSLTYGTKPEITRRMPADIRYCPTCGEVLSDGYSSHTKNVIDIIDGQACSTQWTIMRRYCKKCQQQHSAHIPSVIDGQRYGNELITQIVVLRHIGVSFEKIEKILAMIYKMPIAPSTLIRMCNVAAEQMRPVYEKTLSRYEFRSP